MKNLITIGLPSKGRLREGAIQFFEKNNFKLTSNGGDRNYFAKFENYPNIKIIYLHAKEIIQRIGDHTLDIGISGLDLFFCLALLIHIQHLHYFRKKVLTKYNSHWDHILNLHLE